MKKTEVFIDACKQVSKEFAGEENYLIGKNHDARFVLKGVYSNIAKKFLYHREANNRRYFVAKHIWRISEISEIPVNEIVSL